MSLTKTLKLSKFSLKQHYVLYTAVRNHWNKDYKPGPYPTTEEQRLAAAKKYGLNVDDYQIYPDDGSGVGDYPKVPEISGDARDPHYPWDNPELKRNFNEPMHPEVDLMGEDRYDVTMKHRVPFWSQWGQFLGVLFGTFAIYFWMERMKMFPAVLPKQYPKEGKVHYTFEEN